MNKNKPTRASLAKLSPPRIPNVLLRERLFESLDRLSDYPVIWISAPGGFGKTVLAASYLQQSGRNSIWYQVDEGDSDPAAFFEFLDLALSYQLQGQSTSMPAFSPEYHQGIEAFSRHYSRILFEQIGENGLLVLDNFQSLQEDSLTHQAMRQFISEIPLGVNVLVLSRSDPGPEYLRFRANGSIALLDWNDIALNEKETEQVCQLRINSAGKKEVRRIASDIHRVTRGWAAGMVLMLEQSSRLEIPHDLGQQENHGLIFEYFAGEVFQQEPKETKEFLLKTALLPLFTIEIAEMLTKNPDAEDVLQGLTRRNFFTYRSASTADAYEYHPLFREFLLSRIEIFFNVRELRKIQSHAGDLLVECDWLTEAATLYCQAKQWDKMSELVKRQGAELMRKGRHLLLRNWLQSFPLEYLEQHPWMEYWLGMSLQPVNTRDSRNHFIRVYEKFTHAGDRPGQLAAWSGIVETYIHDMSCFEDLDHWIQILEALLEGAPLSLETETDARVSVAMFTALMYRQPDHDRMSYWEDKVREIIFNTPDLTQRLGLGSQLLLYYTVWIGEIPKATVLLKVLKQSMNLEEMDPLSLILWHSTEATYWWKTGETTSCIASVRKGLEVASQFDVHVYDVLLLASGIYASCSQNRLDQAQAYLDQMESHLNRSRLVDVVHFHYLAAGLAIVRGELGIAREYAETALDAGHKSGALYPETLARLILALCLIRQGKLAEVVFHLSRISDLAERINSHSLSYLNRLVASEAAFSCREMERGIGFLKDAFEHERDLGRVYHGFWWDRSLAENCIQALEQNLEVDFIQRLIRSHELIPTQAPLHLDNWVWPIRIHTLGRFTVTHYGKALPTSAKSSKKPFELLKVLIAQGGRQVGQESLIEILWPDSEGDAAVQSLYTTTHRLRKMLTEQGVVMEDGRLSLDPRYIWVDCLAFLRMAGGLQDCLVKNDKLDPDHVLHLQGQLFHLYQGEFLGSSDISSVFVPMQEKLHLRFLKLIDSLGHYWQSRGQMENSITCFEHALEVDPVAEEFYQSLMTVYMQAGHISEAVSLFHRCRKNLSTILGVSPSKTTVDIYNSIQK